MKSKGILTTAPQMYMTKEQGAKALMQLGENAFAYYANVSDCPQWAQEEVQGMID